MDPRTQFKQYIDMAWRRRYWILIPSVLGLAVAAVLALNLPKVYRASTTILVTRQSIPEDLVRTTVTTRIEERIRSLRVQVMSRRYLEQVVKEFEMVPPEATEREIETACGQLRASTDLDWDRQGLSWFRIMVDSENPRLAAKIANRLAELFIEQNTQLREAQAKGTVETVEGWRTKTESDLRERDDKIAAYKARHLYELPDQEGATLQLLNSAQARIQQLTSDIQLRSEQLSAARAEEKLRRATSDALGVTAPSDDPDGRALWQMKRELQDLLSSYTEENPLVRRKRDQIAQFLSAHPELTVTPAATGSGEPQSSPEVARLAGEIRSLESDRAQESRNVDVLKKRIANMPLRQQELAQLTRDYDSLKRQYDSTVAQKEQAQRAQDIESARKGEQFQIQDRAGAPALPFKPVLSQYILFGLLGGLAAGVGFAALLEFFDSTVRNEEELGRRYPDLPVLGSIPNLDKDTTQPRGGRGVFAGSKSAAGAVLVAAAIAEALRLSGGFLA